MDVLDDIDVLPVFVVWETIVTNWEVSESEDNKIDEVILKARERVEERL